LEALGGDEPRPGTSVVEKLLDPSLTKEEVFAGEDLRQVENLREYLRRIGVTWRVRAHGQTGRLWLEVPLDKLKLAEGETWKEEV
jgi:hypothetical protein